MRIFVSKTTLLTLLSLTVLILSVAQAQLQSRPDIQPLHPATLSFIHQRFPYVIVHFYDSRAPKSTDHENFMTMLSSELPNHYPGVKLASFDIKANETARELYDIPQNNNLLFFIKGNPVPDTFTGDLTMEDLLDWLKYRIATKVIELESFSAADELISSMDLVLIYFGSIYSDAFTGFVETMTAFNEPNTTFARTNDMGMMFEFGHDGESEAVILFRNQDEERNLYTGPLFTMESLRAFVKIYKYPAVMTYSKQARSRLQTSREDAIVLFRNQDEEGDRLQVIFNGIAPEYREKMIFLYTESEESFGHSVAGYMNKEKTDYPMVVIISGQNMLRFVLDRDITERNLRIFIHNYFEGNLKHYLRSETIPAEEYEQGVKALVGKNYWKTVLDEDKDVLVAFYSPDCPFSEDLFKFYPAFARKLKSVENLVIAKINNDMNDLEDLTVLNVPSLYFYPRGRKTRPLIQRRAGNMRVIVEFLQRHATVDIPDGLLQANKFANKVTGTR